MKKYLVLIVTIALLLSGCSSEQAVAEPVAPEAGLEKLTIGVMPDVGAAPFVLADENGYFEELGLDVEVVVFRSAMDRDAALQTGNLDGAMADMLPVVFFNDADFGVKVTSQTYGNYRMVTSPVSDITSMEDIADVQIGLSTNTVIEFATDQIAALNGFEEEVTKVAIPKMPIRLEMLNSGELDIATLPEPLASAAVLDGGMIIGDTMGLNIQPGVFVFSNEAIESKPEEITAMYQAYNKAVDYINETPIEEYFTILVDVIGFPPVLEGQFEMPELEHAGMASAEDFDYVQKWMQEKALTESTYDFADVSTDQFIQ